MRKSYYFPFVLFRSLPLINSLLGFNFLFSMVLFFKFCESYSMIFSIFLLRFRSILWWFFYSSDFNYGGSSFFNLEIGLKFSILLFISSEVFFFFSFFWGYFHFLLSPVVYLGYSWTPWSLKIFDFVNFPLLNTIILLTSGVTVTLAHRFMVIGNYYLFHSFLFTTFFLGFIFSLFQGVEYYNSFFSIRDSRFGSIFFLLTGFHGIHVIVGSLFLTFCFFRSLNFFCKNNNFFSFELARWYWHFVDVVWIFLYFFVYFYSF